MRTDLFERLNEMLGSSKSFTSKPVDLEEIESAELKLGRPLPAELRSLLLTVGTFSWVDPEFQQVELLAPAGIAERTLRDVSLEVDDSLSPKVKPVARSPARTIFAISDYLVFQIDEDPAATGEIGQVVAIDAEEGTVELIASSLSTLVEAIVARSEGTGESHKPQRIPVIRDARADTTSARSELQTPTFATTEETASAFIIDLIRLLPTEQGALKANINAAKVRQKAHKVSVHVPDELVPYFSSVRGQKSFRVGLLPNPDDSHESLRLLSIEDACDTFENQDGQIERHRLWRKFPTYAHDREIKAGAWRKQWFPIGHRVIEHREDVLFVDLDPAPGGVYGQVVHQVASTASDVETVTRKVVAASLRAYYGALVVGIRNGALAYDPKRGLVRASTRQSDHH